MQLNNPYPDRIFPPLGGFEIIKYNRVCLFFVVEGNHHFVIIQENYIDETINEHLPVRLLPYIQPAEDDYHIEQSLSTVFYHVLTLIAAGVTGVNYGFH